MRNPAVLLGPCEGLGILLSDCLLDQIDAAAGGSAGFQSTSICKASSRSRRIASLRVILFSFAHASTRLIWSGGILRMTCGSFPVAGRPRLLGITFIDFFMI